MEAEQATFGTFNTAAERVAENLEEDSPGVVNIQEKMEEFNERWNRITTDVSNRIELVCMRVPWNAIAFERVSVKTRSRSVTAPVKKNPRMQPN